MSDTDRDSLATHLRSLAIDNFAIGKNDVRIGGLHWRVSRCHCNDPACDGWLMEPINAAEIAARH